jgi:ribose transport system substrate-binding protein
MKSLIYFVEEYMKIGKKLAIGLVLVMMGSFVFAGGKSDTGGTKQIVVGYAPTTMNNPFWLAVLEGVKSVLEPQGIKIVTIDPQSDQARMNDQIGDLLAQGIDALLVAPFDSAAIRPALVECKNKGVPIINFDTPVADQDLVTSIVASDNVNAGVVVAKDMMSKLPRGSKVAILHSPSGQACIDRYDGFIKESNGYFTIIQPVADGKGDTGVSMPIAGDFLRSTPDLAAFFAVNDPSAAGCINALREAKNTSVLVYGVDGSPDAKQLISEGTQTGTGAQSPISIGKKTAEAAIAAIKGQPVQKNIVIETFIINAANIGQYNIAGWQ